MLVSGQNDAQGMTDLALTSSVHNTRIPIPHLEHPKKSEEYPLRVSFLEHQTVQAAQTLFITQLSYKFENWEGMRPHTPILLRVPCRD